MRSFSSYHIPVVKIVTVEPLRAGQPSELILKFTNPTQHQTTITILHLDLNAVEEIVEEPVEQLAESLDKSLTVKSDVRPVIIEPRTISEVFNCNVSIPTSSFILPQRDDAAEYDDSSDTHNIKDDNT